MSEFSWRGYSFGRDVAQAWDPVRTHILGRNPALFVKGPQGLPGRVFLLSGIGQLEAAASFLEEAVWQSREGTVPSNCAGCGCCCGAAAVAPAEIPGVLLELVKTGNLGKAVRGASVSRAVASMSLSAEADWPGGGASMELMPPCALRAPGNCLAYGGRPLACRTAGLKSALGLTHPGAWDCKGILQSESGGFDLVGKFRTLAQRAWIVDGEILADEPTDCGHSCANGPEPPPRINFPWDSERWSGLLYTNSPEFGFLLSLAAGM